MMCMCVCVYVVRDTDTDYRHAHDCAQCALSISLSHRLSITRAHKSCEIYRRPLRYLSVECHTLSFHSSPPSLSTFLHVPSRKREFDTRYNRYKSSPPQKTREMCTSDFKPITTNLEFSVNFEKNIFVYLNSTLYCKMCNLHTACKLNAYTDTASVKLLLQTLLFLKENQIIIRDN